MEFVSQDGIVPFLCSIIVTYESLVYFDEMLVNLIKERYPNVHIL